MNDKRFSDDLQSIRWAIGLLSNKIHSLHEKVDIMSKTVADVAAAIADLDSTTSASLADIAADISALQAAVAAGSTPPDVQPLLDALAAIKAKVVAADPGPQPAPVVSASVK